MTKESEPGRDHEEKKFPSQGVPTKIDPRVLPLLRQLKEWSGIKQYRMVMLLVVNEVTAHPEMVAGLPPHVREGLRSLEADLEADRSLYARWSASAPRPDKGKKKT